MQLALRCKLRTSPFRKCFRFTELRIPRISRIPRIPSTDSGFTDSKGNVRKKSPCFVLLLFFFEIGNFTDLRISRIYGFTDSTDSMDPTPLHLRGWSWSSYITPPREIALDLCAHIRVAAGGPTGNAGRGGERGVRLVPSRLVPCTVVYCSVL